MEVGRIAPKGVARWSVKLSVVGVLVLACGFVEHAAWSAPARPTHATPASTARAATPRVAAKGTYVVRNGDGWFQIAKRNNLPMQKVLAANHATTATKLSVGQVVQLPPANAQATAPKAKAKTTARAPAKPTTK